MRRTTLRRASTARRQINQRQEFASSSSGDPFQATDPAAKAGSLVADQIQAIVDTAVSRAHEIKRVADEEAQATRQDALATAMRILERIDALERAIGALVSGVRREGDLLDPHRAAPPVTPISTASPIEDATVVDEFPTPKALDEPKQAEEERPADEPRRSDEATAASEAVERPAEAESLAEEAADAKGPDQAEQAERVEEPEATPEAGEARASSGDAEEAPARGDADTSQAPERHERSGQTDQAEPEEAEAARWGAKPIGLPTEPVTTTAPGEVSRRRRRGLFRRFQGRGRTFVTEPGQCSVCDRELSAGSTDALAESGWQISDDVGLCPHCQADGWQLPEGARLPFRPTGA